MVQTKQPQAFPEYEDLIQQTLRQYQSSQLQPDQHPQGLFSLNVGSTDDSPKETAVAEKKKDVGDLASLVQNSLHQYQRLATSGDLSIQNLQNQSGGGQGSDITLEKIYQIDTKKASGGNRTHPISSDSDSFRSDENQMSKAAAAGLANVAKRPRPTTTQEEENNVRRKLLKSTHGARKGSPEANVISDSASTFSGVTSATVSDTGSSSSGNEGLKTDSSSSSIPSSKPPATPLTQSPLDHHQNSDPVGPKPPLAPKNSAKPPPKAQAPSSTKKDPSPSSSSAADPVTAAPAKKASTAGKTEEQLELERKRALSRISSRRSRERERQRLDYWRGEKEQLEQNADKLRKENALLKELIEKIKHEMHLRTIQSALLGNLPGIMFK
jgi:hypothetical protein